MNSIVFLKLPIEKSNKTGNFSYTISHSALVPPSGVVVAMVVVVGSFVVVAGVCQVGGGADGVGVHCSLSPGIQS